MRITFNRMAGRLGFVVPCLAIVFRCIAGRAADVELRPVVGGTKGVATIEYRSGNTLVWRSLASAPAGVELLLPGAKAVPVEFRAKTGRAGVIELGTAKVGALTLRL